MRQLIVPIMGVLLLTGCTSGPTDTVQEEEPLVCTQPDDRTLTMIAERIGLFGELGPYNPTVVRISSEYEIISFGWGGSSRDTYLARTDSTDPFAWILVGTDDTYYWDALDASDPLLARAQDAASVAKPCVMGG